MIIQGFRIELETFNIKPYNIRELLQMTTPFHHMTPSFITLFSAGLVGLSIGSFLNVVIYRLPRNQSIVFPGSACPHCGNAIRWYDNIPLLGWIRLKGRCRCCRKPIALQYPMVELLGAAAAVAALWKFGLTLTGGVSFIFLCLLISITFIDLAYQIIPDRITLPAMALALLASPFLANFSLFQALLGLVAGGGTLWAIATLHTRLTGVEGIGGGDIKLMGLVGALTGWPGALFTLFGGAVMGAVVGVTLLVVQGKNMRTAIPFGPFLSVAAALYLFYGNTLINWYLDSL